MFCKLKPLDRIKGWLARRDYSQRELCTRIERTFPELEGVSLLLDELIDEGYLNEERFSLSRARHRATQGYGPYRLCAELKEHRIKDELIQQAVDSVDWQKAWAVRVRKASDKVVLTSLAVRTGFPVGYAKEKFLEE